jgi:Terminase large subunit gpA, endonuclease domain
MELLARADYDVDRVESIANDEELALLRRAAPEAADESELSAYEQHKRDAAERSRAKSKAGRDIGPLPPVTDPELRAACESSLLTFLETVFPSAFSLGWCDDHLLLISELQRVVEQGGFRAIGLPRGSGKSTIVMRAMLWAICRRLHSFAVIAAANSGKAEKLLRDLIVELMHNGDLLALFPEVAFPFVALEGVANRARGQLYRGCQTNISTNAKTLSFATLEGHPGTGAVISAAGLLEAVRGAVHTLPDGRVIRPSLLLCDDFQTRESANSPLQCHNRNEVIQNDLIGMAGPDASFCALVTCTVIRCDDAADRLLNPAIHPDWCGIRRKFLRSMPSEDAMRLWSEYAEARATSLRTHGDIRDATKYYAENREAMDAGASASWPARFAADRGEISAVQHAMEWYYRSRTGFFSELQNEPESEEQSERAWLSAADLATERNLAMPRGVIPRDYTRLVADCDVQGSLLYYTVAALKDDGSTHVIRYGTWPEQVDPYFHLRDARKTLRRKYRNRGDMAALSQGIVDLADWLFTHEWATEDGDAIALDLAAFDARWKTVIVRQALARSDHSKRLLAYFGQSYRAGDKPIQERKFAPGSRVGVGWVLPKRKTVRECKSVTVDVNFWKTNLHDQLAIRIGHPGAVTLYDGKHRMLAEHLTGEFATETQGRGRTVMEWRLRPGAENHLLDTTVGCLVLGSMLGCNVPEVSEAVERKKRRRKRRKTEVKT